MNTREIVRASLASASCARTALVFLIASSVATMAWAQPQGPGAGRGGGAAPVEPTVIAVWEGAVPEARGSSPADVPTLTHYAPGRGNTRTAVIVFPGGGYGALALNHEGRQVANWLNAQGVTAFVLRYRLGPTYRHPVPLNDALRAIRIVRARGAEFGVNPDRIGILGFSAGGHLASTVATRFDAGAASATDPIARVSSRPDFVVLGYPVIASAAPYAHEGSFRNLLGDGAPADLRSSLSNDTQVGPDTPPTFLFHTNADTAVPPENSVLFYLALRKANVPAELHIFEPGPHGVGLALSDPVLAEWPALLSNWLRLRGLLSPPPTR
jgi:acetyl esterase/lipase